MPRHRQEIVRELLAAYVADDVDVVARRMTDDFTFSSPPDPLLDRAAYLERCWPNGGRVGGFDVVRMIESGDEVVVTYEATRADGTRFRNTEVSTFAGERIARQEVYFGWDL